MNDALGKLSIHEVTPGKIELFLQRKAAMLQPQSINHLRGYLSRAFMAAIKAELFRGVNPTTLVSKRKVPTRVADYLRHDEVARLLAVMNLRWVNLFATAVYTGLRKGELFGLRKRDVDLQTRLMSVQRSYGRNTTKGRHADVIPIAAELVPYLVAAIQATTCDLVFPGVDGEMMKRSVKVEQVLRRGLGRAGIVEHFQHVCRRKGCGFKVEALSNGLQLCPHDNRKLWPKAVVRKMRFHDLRHTTASLLMMRGANPAAVQRILRHRDPKKTTEIYGHLSPDYLRGEADRLQFSVDAPGDLSHITPDPVSDATRLLPPRHAEAENAEAVSYKYKHIQQVTLERAKRLELSTFSLGS
jgi:integrase